MTFSASGGKLKTVFSGDPALDGLTLEGGTLSTPWAERRARHLSLKRSSSSSTMVGYAETDRPVSVYELRAHGAEVAREMPRMRPLEHPQGTECPLGSLENGGQGRILFPSHPFHRSGFGGEGFLGKF